MIILMVIHGEPPNMNLRWSGQDMVQHLIASQWNNTRQHEASHWKNGDTFCDSSVVFVGIEPTQTIDG